MEEIIKKQWFNVFTIVCAVTGFFLVYHEITALNTGAIIIEVLLLFIFWLMIRGVKAKEPQFLFGNWRLSLRTFLLFPTAYFALIFVQVISFGFFGAVLCFLPLVGVFFILSPGWYFVFHKFASRKELVFSIIVALIFEIVGLILLFRGCEMFT